MAGAGAQCPCRSLAMACPAGVASAERSARVRGNARGQPCIAHTCARWRERYMRAALSPLGRTWRFKVDAPWRRRFAAAGLERGASCGARARGRATWRNGAASHCRVEVRARRTVCAAFPAYLARWHSPQTCAASLSYEACRAVHRVAGCAARMGFATRQTRAQYVRRPPSHAPIIAPPVL